MQKKPKTFISFDRKLLLTWKFFCNILMKSFTFFHAGHFLKFFVQPLRKIEKVQKCVQITDRLTSVYRFGHNFWLVSPFYEFLVSLERGLEDLQLLKLWQKLIRGRSIPVLILLWQLIGWKQIRQPFDVLDITCDWYVLFVSARYHWKQDSGI